MGDAIVLLEWNDTTNGPEAFAVLDMGWADVPVPTNIDHRFWIETTGRSEAR